VGEVFLFWITRKNGKEKPQKKNNNFSGSAFSLPSLCLAVYNTDDK
jgi:hypothetical protein